MQAALLRQVRWLMAGTVALMVFAGSAAAQDAYTVDQLSQQPRLASPTKTAEMLRSAAGGASGTVRVQFVIGPDGKVEEGSVKTVHSTNDRLTAAAEKVILRIEFRPGEKDGKPVRSIVILPLTFQS
jgi:periplasmic protein TonB